MRQSPELKPNIWDGLVVLVILALAMFAALAVWRGTVPPSLPSPPMARSWTALPRRRCWTAPAVTVITAIR